MPRLVRFVLPTVVAAALVVPAHGQVTAYAVESSVAGAELVRVDIVSGARETVGPLGEAGRVGGLTFDPSGTLLGFSYPPLIQLGVEEEGGRLLAIDTETGASTLIAAFDLGEEVPSGLASDACGRLFVSTVEVVDGERVVRLRVLDPQSGSAPLIGVLPDVGPLTARGEDLYAARPGYSTGEDTVILRIRPSTLEIAEIPVQPSPFGPFFIVIALDFDSEGSLWTHWWTTALVNPLPPPPPAVRFDLETGEAETFPQVEYGSTFALSPPGGVCVSGAPPTVPAVGDSGLLLLAAALAAAGAVALRRRYSSP